MKKNTNKFSTYRIWYGRKKRSIKLGYVAVGTIIFITVLGLLITNQTCAKSGNDLVSEYTEEEISEETRGEDSIDTPTPTLVGPVVTKPIPVLQGGNIQVKPHIIKEPPVLITDTLTPFSTKSPMDSLLDSLGDDIIENSLGTFRKYSLPDIFYPDIDYSSFQPYMDYRKITDKTSLAYSICYSNDAYTDQYGLRRFKTSDDEFKIDDQDDYLIALGNYYKEKGTLGGRYLIVTTTGMYTARTGDEKADKHTDPHNMYSYHGDRAGVIEWIVEVDKLEDRARTSGTITRSSVEVIQGEILYIYRIE